MIPIRPVPSAGPRAAPPPAPDDRWRLARLLVAPHRLGFCAAAFVLAISAAWWLAMLAARAAGVAVPWTVPPALVHGLLMAGGFMPLFIVGFLFTAGPKWLGVAPPPARALLEPVAAMVAGWLLLVAGSHLAAPLAVAGVALAAAGWSLLLGRFVGLLRASRVPDRLHAGAVAMAGGIGALALWVAAGAIAAGQVDAARMAVQAMIWLWLAPTFAAVSHRMLPFFTQSALPAIDAWRPNWLLAAMLAALATTGAVAVLEVAWWPLPAALRWLQVAVEAPAAAWLAWLALRWGLLHTLRIRLLVMLHAGFAWLAVAFALAALSHARLAMGDDGLGLAPLHALTMGYLGTTLVAMITRVTAGHGGRPLSADDLAWAIYWTVHLAAVLRVVSALWPSAANALQLAAAAAWAVAACTWAWRYGGWLGRPRADGRPG